jgi:uncharacterized membrane protein YfcA
MGMAVFQSVLQRKDADFRLACCLGVPSLIASFVGVRLLLLVDSIWLKRPLGLLFFLLGLEGARKTWLHAQQQRNERKTEAGIQKAEAVGINSDLHTPLVDAGSEGPVNSDVLPTAPQQTEFEQFGFKTKMVVALTGITSGLIGGLCSVAGRAITANDDGVKLQFESHALERNEVGWSPFLRTELQPLCSPSAV